MLSIPHGGCNWAGCKECFPDNKKYAVVWSHVLGGSNTEYVFAPNKEQARKEVMDKYDMYYQFRSVTVV